MKTLLKRIIPFTFSIVLVLFSCATEEIIDIDESDKPSITANSALATAIQRTSLNDGSNDNIIDKANCFNIQLPVNVIVNGQNFTVTTQDDFETIEAIYEEFSTDDDTLEIVYPITIILSDFTPVQIANETAFDTYTSDCNGENESDDDIECLDFQYPITASIFNEITEVITDISINDDQQLYNFIEMLDDNDTATINFPITVIISDGTGVIINSLEQLEAQIEAIKDDCDEDDDYDYDDDDIDDTTTTAQEFIDYLVSCSFIIDEVEINDEHLENLNGTILTFSSDGTLTANLNSVTSNGTWNVTIDNGLRLTLSMDSLTEINNSWRLNRIVNEDDGKDQVDLREGTDELKLIKNCN